VNGENNREQKKKQIAINIRKYNEAEPQSRQQADTPHYMPE
jgi:hypothetical protein